MTDTIPRFRTDYPTATDPLILAGTLASTPLRNVSRVTDTILDHVVRNAAPCGTLPSEDTRGDVSAIASGCVEFIALFLDGRGPENRSLRVQQAAARWAREGIPLESIHHAMHEAAKVLLSQLTAEGSTRDTEAVCVIGHSLVAMLACLSTTVSTSYLHELSILAGRRQSDSRALAGALLNGAHSSTIAREYGVEIADEYTVLAVGLPPLPATGDRWAAERARRRARVEQEFHRRPEGALPLLGEDGGTVLLPAALDEASLRQLIDDVAAASTTAVTAVAIDAPACDLTEAAGHAGNMLDLLKKMCKPPGVYRFTDFVIEYQMSHPGIGRRVLTSLLDPLEPHPELVKTLETYFAQNLNRKSAARLLHIHPNTMQYRFRRIAELTGFDPTTYRGAHYLHAALMAGQAEGSACPAAEPAPPVGLS